MMVTLLNLMEYDPDLFADITLPADLDADTLENEILMEAGQLYPIHQDPALLKAMINHYFKRRLLVHTELAKTLSYDYEPLENYDRTETRSHSKTGSENVGRERNVNTDSSGTTESQVSAYNEDDYQPQSKDISAATQGTEEDESIDRDTSESGTETARIHGNIGVTTSQQMLQSQRDVVQFDIYEFIAAHFIKTFMIGIY